MDAPPGWYADPQEPSRQRWWDGSNWTEHVQASPSSFASPGRARASDSEARTWAMLAHLSALAGLFIGVSFVGPLVIYLVKRDDHPFTRQQAAEALNFNLSFMIYIVTLGLVTLILILFVVGLLLIPVLLAMAVAWIVLTVTAALRANRGEPYRYPLTIRFVR